MTEILTASSRKASALDEKTERALAFPPKPVASVQVPSTKAQDAPASSLSDDTPEVTDSVAQSMEPSGSEPITTGGEGKCQHVKSAVKLPKLKKGIAHQRDWNHCQGCQNAESKAKKLAQRKEVSLSSLSISESEGAGEPLSSESLWMCLTCCEINCGREIKKHSLAHHDIKKNNHPLVINLGTMDCW